MKKILLIAAALGISLGSFAQKALVRSAKNYLGSQDYEKAKKSIDEAVASEYTKDDPYAWYTRGLVYLTLQEKANPEGKDFYNEAGKSLKKAVELKPDYEREDVNRRLFGVAVYNFNNGLAAYEKQDYGKAGNNFQQVAEIHDMDNGKRFAGKSWQNFDTVARQASAYAGYSAFYDKKYDEALPFLLKAKNDPVVKDPNIYLMIAEIYEMKNDDQNLLTTLAEAKEAYPDNKTITSRELNYFIKAGKTDVLISKLGDAIKADPANPDLLFTLAVAYDNIANPKDNKGNDLPKPADYDKAFEKAEQAYKNALTAADRSDINLNTGVLYFNRAVLINEEMNNITGTSNAEIKKYDELKAKRDEWFNKALPYFEKVITLAGDQPKNLQGEEMNTYQLALQAAKEIYAKTDRLQKAKEYTEKLNAVTK